MHACSDAPPGLRLAVMQRCTSCMQNLQDRKTLFTLILLSGVCELSALQASGLTSIFCQGSCCCHLFICLIRYLEAQCSIREQGFVYVQSEPLYRGSKQGEHSKADVNMQSMQVTENGFLAAASPGGADLAPQVCTPPLSTSPDAPAGLIPSNFYA